MADALSQVKREMGTDAVILHTRTVHTRFWLGLRSRELVEITAGRGLRVADRHPRRAPSVNNGPAAYALHARHGGPEAASRLVTAAAAGVSSPAKATSINPLENSRQLMQSSVVEGIIMKDLTREVGSLKTLLNDLLREQKHKQAPSIPEELFDHYNALVQNEVCEDTAAEVIKNIYRTCRPEHLSNVSFVREKLVEQIEKLIPVGGPLVRTKSVGPHVVALIGPTGVGKTTTIAKLAANLKLREKHKVGLITLDTYRIAAVDQLKKYADIIGAPLRVAGSADDMRAAVSAMHDCDFILIDTAGRSPSDAMKLNELKGFLAAAAPDEVHLVVSSTASQKCAEMAVRCFTDVRVDKLIFTKIDEAPTVGGVLNVMRKMNKSLSYITTGQDVPDDIEVGHGRRVAELILRPVR